MTGLQIAAIFLFALYAGVFAVYAILFYKEIGLPVYLLKIITAAVAVFHLVFLTVLGVTLGHPPIVAPGESLSSLAILIALVYIYVEWRTGIRSTGALIYFFVACLQAVSAVLMLGAPPSFHEIGNPILNIHIALSLLGSTAFCISFLYSIMYLILHDEIKKSHFGIMYEKLPSLEQLDEMNYYAAAAGLAALTLAIVVGFAWAWAVFGKLPVTDIKAVTMLATALIYGVMIFMKNRYGWSGDRLAMMSVAGFFAVLLSLALSNIFMGAFQSYF
jgi:ABC-type uncharacterized transport system permease subunit